MIGRTFDKSELRRQENLPARHLGEHLADQLLCMPVAVGICCIPMRDAATVCGDQGLLRQAIVVAAPADGNAFVRIRATMAPRAETDGGNAGVGAAEADGLHRRSFSLSPRRAKRGGGISGGAA